MIHEAKVWQSDELVRTFLTDVRGAIPLAVEQIDVMLRLIEATEQDGRPIRRVLDLGCGDGVLAAAVLERFPDAAAWLVDFSQPMLDAAHARFTIRPDRVTLACADFAELDWTGTITDGAPFDAVVSGYAIHHHADEVKRRIYRQIHDLLAFGGVFVHMEHVAPASDWIEAVAAEHFIDALHRHAGDGRSRQEVAERFFDRPDKAANILTPVERQCDWLREIGYRDVDCCFKVFELAVFGGRRGRVDGEGPADPRGDGEGSGER